MKHLSACHDCDLLQEIPPVPRGAKILCRRCGAILLRHKPNTIERTLAWTLAGLILFVLANSFPFLGLKSGGLEQETTLTTGILMFYQQGNPLLAAVVALTCLVFPLLQLLGLLHVLLPLHFNVRPILPAPVFRMVMQIEDWGMLEVFMLGILVSLVKLSKMAIIVPGISLYSFGLLILVLAAAANSLDRQAVWEKLGSRA